MRATLAIGMLAIAARAEAEPAQLRAPESFASIPAPKARAQALFVEAAKALLHPRCVNCHPAGDTPTQGDRSTRHDPPVVRGPGDRGVPALTCASCHQDRNLELARVPGAPAWRLAPRVMAWAGRTPPALCAQLKDRARNGGRSIAQIVEHVAHDDLVAWGWAPGADRVAVPGSQATLAALLEAWRKDGAACPDEEKPR